MTIETRFKEGDAIFFINSHTMKVVESIVRGYKIECLHGETEITWLYNNEVDQKVNGKISDKFAYPNREELLKSI